MLPLVVHPRLERLHGLATASGALWGSLGLPFANSAPVAEGSPTGPPGDGSLASRAVPSTPRAPTVRVDVTPRERLPHARRAAGPSPPTTTTAQGPRFGRAPATASGYKTCLRADPHR